MNKWKVHKPVEEESESCPFYCYNCNTYFYPDQFLSRKDCLTYFTIHRKNCGDWLISLYPKPRRRTYDAP